MFPYVRWDHWVKHSLMNYSCNLCRKNSYWQIKESWSGATRTKWLKTKTGKHLRVFYRIQIFFNTSPFLLVNSSSWKQNLSKCSSSFLVTQWVDLQRWWKVTQAEAIFTNDMLQPINWWILNGAIVSVEQVSKSQRIHLFVCFLKILPESRNLC